MQKKCFPYENLNKIPCALAAFKNNGNLELICANEYYYSEFSGDNTETLNICDEDRDSVSQLIEEKLSRGETAEVNYASADGGIRIWMSVCRYTDEICLGALWNVTEQHNSLKALEDRREKYAMIISGLGNLVFEHDTINNKLTMYMPSNNEGSIDVMDMEDGFESLRGLVHPVEEKFFFENICNEKEATVSARMKLGGDTEWKWYRIHRRFLRDEEGNLTRIVGTISNIDEEKQRENELKQKFELDPVLKVYTRNAAVDRINEYLKTNPDRRDFALLVVDIDNFKHINDTFGHLYGDAVISMCADVMNSVAGEKNIVGRYGGDEFFVFLSAMSDDEIKKRATEIVERVSSFKSDNDIKVTSSVGICLGTSFEASPLYKDMFAGADKALYFAKQNGKAQWVVYDDVSMAEGGGHALDYEDENGVDKEKLLESMDMMKVFLELSAGAKTSDEAVYNILRFLTQKFKFDWMQIMQVNCNEDLITIKYEWCNDPDFHNHSGRSGYYVHSDIMLFRNHFEKSPTFLVCDKNTEGFSQKFQREFEKNMRHSVFYNANVTTDNIFYMFVCTRFGKEHPWEASECEEINTATKMMTMYISQSDRETENERTLKKLIDYDRKTGLYSIAEFYVQLGRLRKLARENNEEVAVINIDIGNFLMFNRKFGIEAGDSVLFEYARTLRSNYDEEHCISTHLDGTDLYYSAIRIKQGDREFIKKIQKSNEDFCDRYNGKYSGAELTLRMGVYVLKGYEDGGYGLDNALLAKRAVKNPGKSFFAIYDEKTS